MDIVERLRMTPETGADPDLIYEAVEEIEMLRDELRPMWNDAGEAATLAAAAEDADEWLLLIERLHGRGVWKFPDGESLQKLRCCRESLRSRLRHNAKLKGDQT